MLRRPLSAILGAALLCATGFHLLATESVENLLREATAAEQQGDAARALERLRKAHAAQPDDPDILQRLSQQCSDHSEDLTDRSGRAGLCAEALAFAQRALELEPRDPANPLSVAIAYGKLALLAEPRTQVEYSRLVRDYAMRALALDPDYDYAHHVLGRWHYEVATVGAPKRWLAKLVYGGLPPASTTEAVAHLSRAVALAPNVAAHHAELGFALLADGQTDAGLASLRRACDLPARDHHDRTAQQRARAKLEHAES